MVGVLSILNVSDGDTKLTFDPEDPAAVKRSAEIVQDMIRKGYVILIEAGKNDKGPLYQRVLEFDPNTAEYIIAGEIAPQQESGDAAKEHNATLVTRTRKSAKRKSNRTRVPATGARAVATPRVAGG